MRFRLIAGTINHYHPEEDWEHVHLDIADRPIHMPTAKGGVFVKPDVVCDIAADEIRHIFNAGLFSEIRMHHVIEHLDRRLSDQVGRALTNCHWLLEDGGVLDIEAPNFDAVATAWFNGDLDLPGAEQWVYGEELARGGTAADCHRSIWNPTLLAQALTAAGFDPGDPIHVGHAIRYVARKDNTTEEGKWRGPKKR